MRTSLLFLTAVALWCLFENAVRADQRQEEQLLNQLNDENIQSLQFMELPPASQKDRKQQGVVATLLDGRQFLIQRPDDVGSGGGNPSVEDVRHMNRRWRTSGAPVPARHGYKFGDVLRDCRRGYNFMRENCRCRRQGGGRRMPHNRRRQ